MHKCLMNFRGRVRRESNARRSGASARGAAAARSCRARCRRVVSELARGCCGRRRAHNGGLSIGGVVAIGRRRASTERDPSCGDRTSNFDALTRAIGREIQNGVSHADSARPACRPSVPRARTEVRRLATLAGGLGCTGNGWPVRLGVRARERRRRYVRPSPRVAAARFTRCISVSRLHASHAISGGDMHRVRRFHASHDPSDMCDRKYPLARF